MSDDPDSGNAKPRLWWDPFGFWAGRVAPDELNQPILPGWVVAGTVTVNERNSSAPETEREIVAAESYGRQIGRMSDALAVLIAEWPEDKPKPAPIREFEELRTRVDRIKLGLASRRAKRFLDDMALLKRDNAEEFRRIADQVRRLEAEDGSDLPEAAARRDPVGIVRRRQRGRVDHARPNDAQMQEQAVVGLARERVPSEGGELA